MTRIHSLYRICFLLAFAITIAAAFHGHHAQASTLIHHGNLQAMVGGSSNQTGCVMGMVALSATLLAGACIVAATGGAGAVFLALAGAYSPLGALAC